MVAEDRHTTSSEAILWKLHEKAKARQRQILDQPVHTNLNKGCSSGGESSSVETKLKQKTSEEQATAQTKQGTSEILKKKKINEKKKSLSPGVILKKLHAKAKACEKMILNESADALDDKNVVSSDKPDKESVKSKQRSTRLSQVSDKEHHRNHSEPSNSMAIFSMGNGKTDLNFARTSKEKRKSEESSRPKLKKAKGKDTGSNVMPKENMKSQNKNLDKLETKQRRQSAGDDQLQGKKKDEVISSDLIESSDAPSRSQTVKTSSVREFRKVAKSLEKQKKEQSFPQTTSSDLKSRTPGKKTNNVSRQMERNSSKHEKLSQEAFQDVQSPKKPSKTNERMNLKPQKRVASLSESMKAKKRKLSRKLIDEDKTIQSSVEDKFGDEEQDNYDEDLNLPLNDNLVDVGGGNGCRYSW